MFFSTAEHKPKLLSLGPLNYADGGEGYLEDFHKLWDIHVLVPSTTQTSTLALLLAQVASHGPYEALMVHGLDRKIDEEVLTPLLPSLKIVVSVSTGFNEFDIPFMTTHGIWFCNTKYAIAEATADLGVWMMLSVVRDTRRAERELRGGRWRGVRGDNWPTGDPEGLVVGIVGMGEIGKHIARKVAVFDMKVRYYNRTRLSLSDEAQYNATYCSNLASLLSTCDVLSINCPLNESTRGLIGRAEFALMKQGSFLINTARAAIVSDEALIEAVKSGKIKRVGLDVFSDEPNVNPFFLESDAFTLQPHMGGLTVGTFRKAERECCENLRAWAESGRPLGPINVV